MATGKIVMLLYEASIMTKHFKFNSFLNFALTSVELAMVNLDIGLLIIDLVVD